MNCFPCPADFFSPNDGATTCSVCPEGLNSLDTGGTVCTKMMCDPSCAAQSCTRSNSASSCTACADGHVFKLNPSWDSWDSVPVGSCIPRARASEVKPLTAVSVTLRLNTDLAKALSPDFQQMFMVYVALTLDVDPDLNRVLVTSVDPGSVYIATALLPDPTGLSTAVSPASLATQLILKANDPQS